LFERLKSGLEDFINNVSKTELSEKTMAQLLEDFKLTLLQNDVAYSIAEKICNELSLQLKEVEVRRFGDHKKTARTILREVLLDTLNKGEQKSFLELVKTKRETKEPAVIVFVGINGTGKTTSIAKIAHLLMKNGYTTVVACADTYRTGSIEQIEEHARRLGVRTIKHDYGSDAAAVAYDTISHAKAHGIDTVLIDTAGRMQTNKNLLDEMKKVIRIAKPDLILLVVDSLTGNDAVEQGSVFSQAVPINGIILTKLDADAKGGSAISISSITEKPVMFLGVGQEYSDLIPFDPNYIVNKILGE
jgi:fused signal recognition particle receptor